jgi:pantoate--beta-alanine ligase
VQREQATILYKALQRAAELAFHESVSTVGQVVQAVLAQEPTLVLDYFGIADHDTLEPISEWGTRDKAVALIAAQVGPVRLIDNITLFR